MNKKTSKLIELNEPIHRLSYRVIYGDTDSYGVMYYGNYLRIFEIGRTEFLRSVLRMSCLEISQQGIILPVSEVYCRYKAPAHYDDLLEISTSLANTSKYSIRFNFLIHRLLDYRLLVKGYSIHSAIDRIGGRLINIPEKLQTALAQICEK